ncbi:MAG: GNAT family N-acetyltransferase [Myxococcota bacterium]
MFVLDEARRGDLRTRRLRLRAPRRSDLLSLHEAIAETLPELIRWLPWAHPGHDLQDTRRYLRGARLARARRQSFELVIEGLSDGALHGIVSLHRIDWLRRSAGLGYWVRRASWGKGIATEAGLRLIEHAFGDLMLHRLEAHVAPANGASVRVVEKLGFQSEGLARGVELIAGAFQDHLQYSLLSTDVRAIGAPCP